MFDNYRSYPSLAMDEVMGVFEQVDHQHQEPINFGKGVSCFNPFDYVDASLNSENLRRHVGYGDINGLKSLRHAICRYYGEKFDYDLAPQRVCITDGASGALNIALAMLLATGGEIILSESHYPAYKVLAQIFEARCILAPIRDDYCIDVEQLPRFINHKTQAILINSPSNPHGAVLSADDLQAIARLGVPVIFDEVYQSLPLGAKPIPSAIHYSDRHMLVNSLSKSLAIAGFRIGYLIVPESHVQLMTNVKAILNMCTSLPSQMLAEKLFRHWDVLVGKHRQMLLGNWRTFEQMVHHFDLRLRSRPNAGFFALMDVAEANRDAMQVSHELARYYALGSTPGTDFQHYDNAFLRLNFACHPHQVKLGLARLANYLQCDERQPLPLSRSISLAARRAKQKCKVSLPEEQFLGVAL